MNYLTTLKELKHENLDHHDQQILNKITEIIALLENKQIPTSTLVQFAPAHNQKLESIGNNFRSFLSRELGIWSVANLTTAKLLVDEFKLTRGLELMSGNAMWSKAFAKSSVKMIATDDLSWSKTSQTGQKLFFPVENLSAEKALLKYADEIDFIIWSWAPDFSTNDAAIIRQYRKLAKKPLLFVVGEVYGHTNSEEFWDLIKIGKLSDQISQSFSSFDFVNEKILRIE